MTAGFAQSCPVFLHILMKNAGRHLFPSDTAQARCHAGIHCNKIATQYLRKCPRSRKLASATQQRLTFISSRTALSELVPPLSDSRPTRGAVPVPFAESHNPRSAALFRPRFPSGSCKRVGVAQRSSLRPPLPGNFRAGIRARGEALIHVPHFFLLAFKIE